MTIAPRTITGDGEAMSQKYSLAHLTVLGCDPPEMTYIAAMAGYDYVSFRLMLMGLPGEPHSALAEDPAMLRQTRTALAETGLKVHDIELVHIHDALDAKSFVPEMEVGAELGARHMIVSVWTSDHDFAVDAIGKVCDLAKPYNLTANLEFVTWSHLTNLQQTVAICRDVNRENCGIMIDTLHFQRSRVALEELDSVPPEWFHFVHVCDAPPEIPSDREALIHTGRGERLYPGEGGIDIAAIVNRLPEVPYSLEVPHLVRAKELGYAEHARRCISSAKAYFAAHSRKQPAGAFR